MNELVFRGDIKNIIDNSGRKFLFIIATYPDKATADAAADKAAAMRAEVQEEYSGPAPTILQGEVIVSN